MWSSPKRTRWNSSYSPIQRLHPALKTKNQGKNQAGAGDQPRLFGPVKTLPRAKHRANFKLARHSTILDLRHPAAPLMAMPPAHSMLHTCVKLSHLTAADTYIDSGFE